jgi:hypothetical protein
MVQDVKPVRLDGTRVCFDDERADPRFPPPRPVAVAIRHPIGGHLAVPSADLRRDLGVHQLRGDDRYRLLEKVAVLVQQRSANELLRRHALRVGHRGAFPLIDRLALIDESRSPR